MKSNRILSTQRLILRPWQNGDANDLFECAKDSNIGPNAGWPPHKNVEESLEIIQKVLNGSECYAICEKDRDKPIGAIELKLNGCSDLTTRDDECELGYWLGKPYWGRGYMSEAVEELIRHGFENLGMTTIWAFYYEGNHNSKKVLEKAGFIYHHTCEEMSVPLLNETRTGHIYDIFMIFQLNILVSSCTINLETLI